MNICDIKITSLEYYLFDDSGCGHKWDGPTSFQYFEKKSRTDTLLFLTNVINQLILSYKSNLTFSSL